MDIIEAPPRLRFANVDSLLAEIAEAPERIGLRVGSTVIEQSAADVLTAALLGPLGDRDIVLELGTKRAQWVEETGLAFALANRSGLTAVTTSDGVDWESQLAIDWSAMWTPSGLAELSLFDPSEWGETVARPSKVSESRAVFVNAHRSPPSGSRHPVATQLWPWLDRLLPDSSALRRGSNDRRELLRDIGSLIDEALFNVIDHALGAAGTTLSLIRVSVTAGGANSVDRLHLTVLDTGPGILATVAAKLPEPMPRGAVLEGLFDGTVRATRSPGHGLGLPRMLEAASRHAGTFQVWANDAVFEATFTSHPKKSAAASEYDLRGTVIHVSIPLPR